MQPVGGLSDKLVTLSLVLQPFYVWNSRCDTAILCMELSLLLKRTPDKTIGIKGCQFTEDFSTAADSALNIPTHANNTIVIPTALLVLVHARTQRPADVHRVNNRKSKVTMSLPTLHTHLLHAEQSVGRVKLRE